MEPKSPRFKVGDLIEVVKYLDRDDGSIQSGIILITGYGGPTKYSPKGTYSTRVVKGSVKFSKYGAVFFDDLPYLVWIGNIKDNKALRILYG